MNPQIIILGISIISLGTILPGVVEATSINEIEGNNTLLTAQQLFGSDFTTGINTDIFDSENTPWASINSNNPVNTYDLSTNSFDYYSFTINAGTTGYFDIDYGFTGDQTSGSADTYLTLLNSIGVVLEERDDGSDGFQADEDNGSMKHIDDDDRTWFFDPSFSYDFTEAGTYYLKVSLYNDLALAQGDSYTLQVSLDPAPVPEPTTILLFGTGLAGLAGSRIRRKKKV